MTINVTFNENKNLLSVLNEICKNETIWDEETLSAARMYEFALNDFKFIYFLDIFNMIFVQTDIFLNITTDSIILSS